MIDPNKIRRPEAEGAIVPEVLPEEIEAARDLQKLSESQGQRAEEFARKSAISSPDSQIAGEIKLAGEKAQDAQAAQINPEAQAFFNAILQGRQSPEAARDRLGKDFEPGDLLNAVLADQAEGEDLDKAA